MSSTLLRLGLWTMVLILALYVVHETFIESALAELIPFAMLGQALTVAGLLVVAGLVLRVAEKAKKVVSKHTCRVCNTQIAAGAIYCRVHLRAVLEREDRKTHGVTTRVR